MKADEKKYNSLFMGYIKDRFQNISSVNVREISQGYSSDKAIDWVYLGIENKSNFYINGNDHLNFFFELEFSRKENLKEKIDKYSKSGNEIDEASHFLARPHREYMRGNTKELPKNSAFWNYSKDIKINSDKDYYFISCKIKRIPDNPKELFDNIWGYLIKSPLMVITGLMQ
jgi:hypothetical protein